MRSELNSTVGAIWKSGVLEGHLAALSGLAWSLCYRQPPGKAEEAGPAGVWLGLGDSGENLPPFHFFSSGTPMPKERQAGSCPAASFLVHGRQQNLAIRDPEMQEGRKRLSFESDCVSPHPFCLLLSEALGR